MYGHQFADEQATFSLYDVLSVDTDELSIVRYAFMISSKSQNCVVLIKNLLSLQWAKVALPRTRI